MNSQKPSAEVTLNTAELHRLRRWYASYAVDPHAVVDATDLVLDAKLKTIRYDLEDRVVVRGDAIRERSSTVRFQHPGVERRLRAVEIAPPVHARRSIRPVLSVTA